jgi:hypothetical protein
VVDDDLDKQAIAREQLPLKVAFDWADSGLRALATTLDDLGHFNAGSTADKIADEIHVLRKGVLGK